ncbi:MAG: exosortase/archaeosortase family protein [Bdellovibrionota bacterium]
MKKTAFACVPLAVLFYLYFPTLREIAEICWNNEDYSHGILLPFISAYFIWNDWPLIRRRIEAAALDVPRLSISGLLLLIVGLLIFVLGEIGNLMFIRWLSLFPALIGTLFLILGTGAAKPFVAPLLINFMAKPLPDSLIPKFFFPLQVLAARVSARTLEFFGVPVYLKGNIIEIPGMQLMVEEACSGLRSLMALLTVALIVIYSVELPIYAKLLLLFGSVFIAIFLNVVRVASTGLLAHFYDPRAATGFFHTFSGMVVFVLGLVILYAFGRLLHRLTGNREKSNSGGAQ